MLEKWFSDYPKKEQNELRNRLRSDNDFQHYSAVFELFVHALLFKLDCKAIVHPHIGNGTNKFPDFLVESKGGIKFYLECVLVTDESREETAARARINAVYDALNKNLKSPNFFVGMELKGRPNTPPNAKKIRSFLEKQLKGLNPDTIAETFNRGGFKALPHWPYEYDGWTIDFFPISKSVSKREDSNIRPLGMQFEEAHHIDSRTAIRDAIIKKAGSYGNFDLPYVIALNALCESVEKTDIEEALFGKENFSLNGSECKMIGRLPDGAWIGKFGPQYKRVSAVLLMYPFSMWKLSKTPICLCHNPWAKNKYISDLNCFPQIAPIGNKLEWVRGKSVGDVMGLSSLWPFNGKR